MVESNNSSQSTSGSSLEDLVSFFDENDMGDYVAAQPEVEFEVDLRQHTYLVSIDGELMKELAQIARERQVSATSLIETWLREKATQAAA